MLSVDLKYLLLIPVGLALAFLLYVLWGWTMDARKH
jgi:hypothetical protein